MLANDCFAYKTAARNIFPLINENNPPPGTFSAGEMFFLVDSQNIFTLKYVRRPSKNRDIQIMFSLKHVSAGKITFAEFVHHNTGSRIISSVNPTPQLGGQPPQNTLSATKSVVASRVVAASCHSASAAAAATTTLNRLVLHLQHCQVVGERLWFTPNLHLFFTDN